MNRTTWEFREKMDVDSNWVLEKLKNVVVATTEASEVRRPRHRWTAYSIAIEAVEYGC